jgi:hypothetical protein
MVQNIPLRIKTVSRAGAGPNKRKRRQRFSAGAASLVYRSRRARDYLTSIIFFASLKSWPRWPEAVSR